MTLVLAYANPEFVTIAADTRIIRPMESLAMRLRRLPLYVISA